MSVWTILWLLWGLAFVVIEAFAVVNDEPDDTLSEHLRKWFRTDTKRGKFLWISVFGIFSAWFAVHIAVEGSI